MKLKKVIAVLSLCAFGAIGSYGTTAQASEVQAFGVDTVINNQSTYENDWKEYDLLVPDVVSGNALSVEVVSKSAVDTTVVTSGSINGKGEAEPNGVLEVSGAVKKKKAKKKYTNAELKLMSCLIYCEANGEPYAGKLAVGIVVMNRKESKVFPNTVKDVVYQKYQFGPVRNGSLSRALKRYEAGKFTSAVDKDCIKAAKSALNGNKSVTYAGKKTNMKSYLFFSTRVSGARLRIKNHQFK